MQDTETDLLVQCFTCEQIFAELDSFSEENELEQLGGGMKPHLQLQQPMQGDDGSGEIGIAYLRSNRAAQQ